MHFMRNSHSDFRIFHNASLVCGMILISWKHFPLKRLIRSQFIPSIMLPLRCQAYKKDAFLSWPVKPSESDSRHLPPAFGNFGQPNGGGTHWAIGKKEKLLQSLFRHPKNMRFFDLDAILTDLGYEKRQSGKGSSHYVGDVLKLDISEICIRLLFSGGKNIFFEEVCSDGVSSGFLPELWEWESCETRWRRWWKTALSVSKWGLRDKIPHAQLCI